ncbi:hypothetical protein GCM10022247_34510 [Allokutzneria multivorans]|uniref:Uncharacterized protein n=1 Tax=Allokutzneria multivorans TaxID=1142134 RepID=A0ABP7SBI0_9PSEU
MSTPRWLVVVLVSAVLGFAAGHALFFATIGPSAPKPDSPLMAHGHCAESLPPNDTAPFTIAISAQGPVGAPAPDRTIALRSDGSAVWAHLEPSRDPLDRFWFDWSYERAPSSEPRWRQCGAQSITSGASTPAVLATDGSGRARWFRACAQVPPHHRGPRVSGVFCTDWVSPGTA